MNAKTKATGFMGALNNSEFMQNADRMLVRLQFGLDVRLALYKKLLTFYSQGIPPQDALKKIHRRMVQRKNPTALILKEWIDAQDRGSNLAQAVREWVPSADVALIAAGEMGGNLDETLQEVITLNMQQHELTRAARSQLIPAAIWLLILWAVVFGISSELLPLFRESTDEKLWPPSSRMYFDFGEFFTTWGGPIVAALTGVGIYLYRIMPSWVGERRDTMDRFLPFSLYRLIQGSALLITLAALTRSGIAPADAMARIAAFSTPYMRDHLRRMLNNMHTKPEGEAIDTGLLPRDIADDIADFGEANGFNKAIDEMGRSIGERTTDSIKKTAGGINMAVKMMIFGFAMWTFAALGFIVLEIANNTKF